MTSATGPVVIYTTFADITDAKSIAYEMVEAGLAGCVNVMPGAASVYRWNGKVAETAEVIALVKTHESRLAEALQFLESRHPYDTPAIMVWRPEVCSQAFQSWIADQTAAPAA